MTLLPIHPPPAGERPGDHRDAPTRDQERDPGHAGGIWKRAVENLASELQISPINAHFLLRDAAHEVTVGLAWEWWDR
jgi:hypothetical protein